MTKPISFRPPLPKATPVDPTLGVKPFVLVDGRKVFASLIPAGFKVCTGCARIISTGWLPEKCGPCEH